MFFWTILKDTKILVETQIINGASFCIEYLRDAMVKRKINRRVRPSGDGMVFSTQPGWQPAASEDDSVVERAPHEETLYVSLDRKQRAGKPVTVVEGYTASGMELLQLGKELKTQCGAGGAVKEGVILVQGDHREKVIDVLVKKGFKIKRKGG
jgi:translation initiation factor 1